MAGTAAGQRRDSPPARGNGACVDAFGNDYASPPLPPGM